MRDILKEVLKQGNLFPVLKVLGTDTDTTIQASSECKTMIFTARLRSALPDLKGEFGITNLNLLNGLLNFPAYNTEASTFSVKRRQIGEIDTVEQFEFAASATSKSKATFRCTPPNLIPEVTTMTGKVTWDIEFEPDRAKVVEFQQLASLYNEVGKTFMPTVEDGHLIFHVGTQNSSTHSASTVFQEDVGGDLTGSLNYPFAMFVQVMKLAGSNPTRMSLKSRSGPLKITVQTNSAEYDYIIRASR